MNTITNIGFNTTRLYTLDGYSVNAYWETPYACHTVSMDIRKTTDGRWALMESTYYNNEQGLLEYRVGDLAVVEYYKLKREAVQAAQVMLTSIYDAYVAGLGKGGEATEDDTPNELDKSLEDAIETSYYQPIIRHIQRVFGHCTEDAQAIAMVVFIVCNKRGITDAKGIRGAIVDCVKLFGDIVK